MTSRNRVGTIRGALFALFLLPGGLQAWDIVDLDTAGDVGEGPSLAIVDGRPAIAYYDETNRALKYIRAQDADGAAWDPPITVAPAGTLPCKPSLAIVAGNPAISFNAFNGQFQMQYVRAGDPAGATWGSPVSLGQAWAYGRSSLAVVNGNPAVAWDGLEYVRADDALGTTWGTPQVVAVNGDKPALAVVDGHPALCYENGAGIDLRYVRALDPDGSAWGSPVDLIVGSQGGFWDLDIEIVNGHPAIGLTESPFAIYYATYVRALDPQGASWGNPQRLAGDLYEEALDVSLEVISGRPALSYRDNAAGVSFIRSQDPDGSAWAPPVVVEASRALGTSLAEVNGLPGIAYGTWSARDLRFARDSIACMSISVTPSTLPSAQLGAPYSQTIAATGGTAPYAYAAVGGLPPGLTLTGAGDLVGTPTALGSYPFTVWVTDAAGCQVSRPYTLDVSCPMLQLAPSSLASGLAGVPYLEALTVSGTAQTVAFGLTSGSLPPGLSLSPTGPATAEIAGTPTQQGSWPFRVEASTSGGCSVFADYVIDVGCPGLTIGPPTLPSAEVGATYSVLLSTTGGVAPHHYALTSGTLPAGLTLSGSGLVYGTPLAEGAASFAVSVTGSAGCTGSAAYVLTVSARSPGNLVLGQGAGPINPNRVRVYRADGTAAPTDFHAYGAGQWGVTVAFATIDAGPEAAILTGPGPGPGLGPQVRAFLPDGTPRAKVNFYAYRTLAAGVNVGSAAVDQDTFMEILSGAGPGDVFGPHMRAWNFDGIRVSPLAAVSFFAFSTLRYGVNVGGGDLEGDDYDELLAGAGPGAVFGTTVRGFEVDGGPVAANGRIHFNAFPGTFGAVARGGDVDADGYDEIGAGRGAGGANPAQVRGFDFDGTRLTTLVGFDVTPFATNWGARLDLADLTGKGAAHLLAGAGPDPAAPAEASAYAYQGASLTPLAGFPITPFPEPHGVDVGGGRLGF